MPIGIENLKQAVHLAVSLPLQIAKSIKSKFHLLDLLAFVDEFKELTEVVKDRKDIIAEIKDLTAEERTELHDFIADEFSLPNEKLELFIENSLAWANATVTLIEEAKNLKK